MMNDRNSPEIPLRGFKNTKGVMISNPLPMDPTRGFTASRTPELHWQLTIMFRGSPSNVIFQSRLWFVVFVSK